MTILEFGLFLVLASVAVATLLLSVAFFLRWTKGIDV